MSVRIRQRNPNAVRQSYQKMVRRTEKEVAVGFPAGKAEAYPDGTPVAQVAAFHVYGLGVPKRDFMGLAKDEITEKAAPLIQEEAKRSDFSTKIYETAGLAAQDAIRNAITDLDDPPNSPATIAKKKSSNPLIDDGHMRRSVTWIVRDRTR